MHCNLPHILLLLSIPQISIGDIGFLFALYYVTMYHLKASPTRTWRFPTFHKSAGLEQYEIGWNNFLRCFDCFVNGCLRVSMHGQLLFTGWINFSVCITVAALPCLNAVNFGSRQIFTHRIISLLSRNLSLVGHDSLRLLAVWCENAPRFEEMPSRKCLCGFVAVIRMKNCFV